MPSSENSTRRSFVMTQSIFDALKRKVYYGNEIRDENMANVSKRDTKKLEVSRVSNEPGESDSNKKGEKGLVDELRNICFNWFEGSTFHGFANLMKPDSIYLRLLWFLIVCSSITYCLYSIIQNIQKYFEYEVTVDYLTVTESPTDFPAITICNANPFDLFRQQSNQAYINSIMSKNNLTTPITLGNNDEAYYTVKEAATILKAYVTSDNSLNVTQKMNLGFVFGIMFVSCYYNGVACDESDFTYFRTHDYGNCYTFNGDSSSIKKTSKTGPDSGLTMELFVGKAGQQDNYTMKSGLYVAIHNQTNLPLVKDEGFIVQTGASANIAIERTFYSRLPSPFSNCRKDVDSVLPTDSQFYKYTSQITKYSQKLCYEICFQYKYAIPRCNCSDPSVPVVDTDQQICNTFASLECIEDARNEFDNSPIGQFCDPYCPLECDSIDYDVSIASAQYPSEYYSAILLQQSSLKFKFMDRATNSTSSVTTDQLSKSLVQFSAFYNTLRYTSVEEIEALSSDTLVGVIGGFLALFLGASVISFMELIELGVKCIILIIERSWIRRTQHQ